MSEERQIVLDTETTGISPQNGHRIIEIGCVELSNRMRTGRTFQVYINPERAVDEGAFRVHGISTDFLKDKPLFQDIVDDLMRFIDGSELIIHNAPFDTGFLNAELALLQWPKTITDHCRICDTLSLARTKHPGQRNTLDALTKRYDIKSFDRKLHGALLDAEILTAVYLAMTGGQGTLFAEDVQSSMADQEVERAGISLDIKESLHIKTAVYAASQEELSRHQEFLAFLMKKSGFNRWED